MRILYDVSSAQPQGSMTINGGGGYALCVLRHLCRYIDDLKQDIEIELLLNNKLGTNSAIAGIVENKGFKVSCFSAIPEITKIISGGQYDAVVFPVCYADYCEIEISRDVRVITVIHDLAPVYEEMLKTKYGRFIKNDGLNILRRIKHRLSAPFEIKKAVEKHRKLINLADKQIIVTVSDYSRSEIEKYVKGAEEKNIQVLYTPDCSETEDTTDFSGFSYKYGIESGKYFLMVSGCRWTKNNSIAMRSIDRMISSGELPGYKAVLLGTDELYRDYYNRILKNRERFILEGYVDAKELNTLYKNARAFIYPSLLEGFGLPPVEAMKHGCVPICSTAMSIPEICSEGAVYIDENSEESIEQGIKKVLDNAFLSDMRDRGKKRILELDHRREKDMGRLIKLITDGNDHE